MKYRDTMTLLATLIMGSSTFGQGQQALRSPSIAGGVSQTWAQDENFSKLVLNSPLIVKGKVVHLEAARLPTKFGNSVSTDSDVEIEATYKDLQGVNAKAITVFQLGGVLDDLVVENRQNPTLKVGEEYILILRPCGMDGKSLWCVAQNKGRFQLVDGIAYQKQKPSDAFEPRQKAYLESQGYPTDVPEAELVGKILQAERSASE